MYKIDIVIWLVKAIFIKPVINYVKEYSNTAQSLKIQTSRRGKKMHK
jgi:hypothetical protein